MDTTATLLVTSFVGLSAACALIGAYVFGAYVLYRIGRKFSVGTFGQYCIPVYNVVLMCRWIGLSGWVALWFYVPTLMFSVLAAVALSAQDATPAWMAFWLIVGPSLAFQVYFWGTVARRLEKSFWLYGLTTIFFLGLPALFLGFDDSTSIRSPLPRRHSDETRNGLSLYCVTGELAHATLAIPGDGLYIGRNPSKANLVLKSNQISNVHARVWPARDWRGAWVEDWNSLNGTYYCPPAGGNGTGRVKWRVLHGRILLSAGARFRLGSRVAEFEVRA